MKAKLEPRPEEGKVTLEFNWGSYSRPDRMQVWIYDAGGSKVDTKECVPASLTMSLPAGKYKVLAVNCGVPEIEGRNMEKYETAGIFLSGSVRSTSAFLPQPSVVYGARTEFEIAGNDSTGYKVSPESYVKSISLKLDFKGNAGLIEGCSAVVKGVSTGVSLSDGQLIHGGNGVHRISLSPQGPAYLGTVNLLGKDEQNTGSIELQISYKQGTEQTLRLDVDDKLREINASGTVSITVELSLQDVGAGAEITGWDVVPGGDMDTERK